MAMWLENLIRKAIDFFFHDPSFGRILSKKNIRSIFKISYLKNLHTHKNLNDKKTNKEYDFILKYHMLFIVLSITNANCLVILIGEQF